MENKLPAEITAKNKGKSELSPVKTYERTRDGNLLPTIHERLIKSIRKYLQNRGYVNITEISAALHLYRETTKKLIMEILEDWQGEIENQTIVQIKWLESVIKNIDQYPEKLGKEERELIKLKSMLLGKINALQKLLMK